MPTTTKARRSKADKLADYLAGRRTLNGEVFSMTDLSEALGQLLDDRRTSHDDIVSRVRKILHSSEGRFDDPNVVRRALKVRTAQEPLFFALMRVRQARMRRKLRRAASA